MNECEICTHESRDVINENIVAGTPRSRIALWFDVLEKVVDRHSREHLPTILEKEGLAFRRYPILAGMSKGELQRRLYLINEIEELQLGMSEYDLKRISAEVEAMG